MYRYLYRRGGRTCLFGHKWVVGRISKEQFEVTETCSWCSKNRVRGLLPADEQKWKEAVAYEKGRAQRLRLTHEIRYESRRGGEGRIRALEVRKQLGDARTLLMREIRAEKLRRHDADQHRLDELKSQLRGLWFGK